MSRCFPFPPPGYEKKATHDDVDLLKKEKHRERKHKKEKKKEKGDKERKKKERSEGKHKEKKRKREKHREKKEEGDKDKDKVKGNSSHEKTHADRSVGHNGVPLDHKEGENKDKHISSDGKKFSQLFMGSNGEKISQNILLPPEAKSSLFMQEFAWRVSGEDRRMADMVTSTERDKAVRPLAKAVDNFAESNQRNTERRVDERKTGSQGTANFGGKSIGCFVQGRVEEMPQRVAENSKKASRGERTEGDDRWWDENKRKDGEKRGEGKREEQERGKKVEKAKDISDQRKKQEDKFPESRKIDLVGTCNNKTLHLPKDSNKLVPLADPNPRKRRHIKTNGLFHANDGWPNKLPRPTPLHPWAENGRTSEPGQNQVVFTSDNRQVVPRANGLVEAPSISGPPTKPPSLPVRSDKDRSKASAKPPHPDARYLDRILSVPKMNELPNDDDGQDWLFSARKTEAQKPGPEPATHEEPQVWAEARHLHSVDIYALPYVIPY